MALRLTRFLSLQRQTIIKSCDDSGVLKSCIIHTPTQSGIARIGHLVRVSVRDKTPDCLLPKLPRGFIIRRKKETRRKDGSVLKFDENAVAFFFKNKPRGTRIKGPVPYEIRANIKNIARKII